MYFLYIYINLLRHKFASSLYSLFSADFSIIILSLVSQNWNKVDVYFVTHTQLQNLKIPILCYSSLLHLTLDGVNTFVFSMYGLTSTMCHWGRGVGTHRFTIFSYTASMNSSPLALPLNFWAVSDCKLLLQLKWNLCICCRYVSFIHLNIDIYQLTVQTGQNSTFDQQ